jgi:thiol-disulfide isomerase/thioredoxin
MRTRLLRLAAGIVALWLAVYAFSSLGSEPDLPDFAADGDAVDLPAPGQLPTTLVTEFEGMIVGAAGAPVIVNVWGSWCAPCRAEMPLLQLAASEHEGEVIFLGVASNDDRASALEFIRDVGVEYPNVFDESGGIGRALELSAFPTTYVFDADGVLINRVEGGVSEQRLAGLIDDVLR